MGWPAIVAGILTGGAGLAAGILNYKSQKDNLEYQKGAQLTSWEREDNAVQRRVADLRAAGLSPTLAAGSAAQTSSPIHTTAPKVEGVYESLIAGMHMAQGLNEMKLRDKQRELLGEEMKGVQWDNALKSLDYNEKLQTLPMKIKAVEAGLEGQVLSNVGAGVRNAYEQMTFFDRMRILENDLARGQEALAIQRLDKELKQFDLNNRHLQKIQLVIQNLKGYNDLTLQEKEILLKEVAVEMAYHDRDIYTRTHVPSGSGAGLPQLLGYSAGRMAKDIVGFITEKGKALIDAIKGSSGKTFGLPNESRFMKSGTSR